MAARASPSEQDYGERSKGDAEDAATIAVSVTTEAATEPTERRDNEDESSDMSLSSPRFRAPTSVIL